MLQLVMLRFRFYLWMVRCVLWFAFYTLIFAAAWLSILLCTILRPSNVYNTHPDWLGLLRMVDLGRHWPKPPSSPTPAGDADWWKK